MQLHDQKDLGHNKEAVFNEKSASQKRQLPAWTGFSNKTLWDLLQFFCTAAVPVFIGLYGVQESNRAQAESKQQALLAQAERKQQAKLAEEREAKEKDRNDDNQRAKIASDYLGTMSEYLLKKSDPSDKVNTIARARTLLTLRQLDPERKGQILKFLYEAGLVKPCQPNSGVSNCEKSKLNLEGARLDDVIFENPVPIMRGVELIGALLPNAKLPNIDLTDALLQKANLRGADLSNAILVQAQMRNVVLEDAIVVKAFLNRADLTGANLTNANLSGAHLRKANLSGSSLSAVNLDEADLTEADIRGTDLTGASLKRAKLINALYDDKTKFPDEFNPARERMRQK